MKKFAAFGILLSLASASSTAMASPDIVHTEGTTSTDKGQKQVVLQQGHLARDEKEKVVPTRLDHSLLPESHLDGNIGGTGATAGTGAANAPGI